MTRLRDFTPRGLYARSLLMVILPIILILALMTWYYYASHIAEVNRKLAQSIARDVSLVQAHCDRPDRYGASDELISERLDLIFTCALPEDAAAPTRLRRTFSYSGALQGELRTRLGVPVDVGLNSSDSLLHIRFPSRGATAEILIERKRALSINSHIFIVWVILFSLIMAVLAIGFLNQQVRSILRLSKAARAFGRGREAPDFRPSGATEVRDAARAVIDMKNRLTAFAEQRTAMLAGVSHDLRTPLTRLKLALAMMDENDDITAARADLDDMSMMLDEYLTFARGEEGDAATQFDIAQLTREVVHTIDADIDVSGPDNALINGRTLALKRTISNLVVNAKHYANTARVIINDGPHAVEIIVDDDGPGISKDKREDAFRPFSRLDESRSQNVSGTGLGLTLARDTARAHGGDLRLGVSPMGGLRAVLRLPH